MPRRTAVFVCLYVLFILGPVDHLLAQELETRVASLPKESMTLHRIAFGSCAKHWQHQPIWEKVIATKPDLFLFLGDAIYADNDGKTA